MTPEQESAIHRSFAQLGANLEIIRGEFRRGFADVSSQLAIVKDRLDKHGRRLAALEHKSPHEPDLGDVTGNYKVDMALIRAEQDRILEAERLRRDSSIWAKRQTKTWIVGTVATICGMLVSAGGSIVFWLLTRK